jgi:hypothetical protein
MHGTQNVILKHIIIKPPKTKIITKQIK